MTLLKVGRTFRVRASGQGTLHRLNPISSFNARSSKSPVVTRGKYFRQAFKELGSLTFLHNYIMLNPTWSLYIIHFTGLGREPVEI